MHRAAPVLLALVLVGAWQAVVVVAEVPAYLLPSPLAILGELVDFLPTIASAALVTGTNALVGLVLGSVVAIAAAVLASAVRTVDALLNPVVAGLAVVPIVALAPVLYTMYGASVETGRQIVVAVAVAVPVFVTTLRGLRQVRPVHRDLMRAYAATPRQAIRAVTIPTALPFVFTGLRLASSLAVISAIVAEYFGGPRSGIGSFITTAAAGSNYARAWAYVLGGVVVGLLFYGATTALERWGTPGARR
ncbi:ABC transporter permease subunit [Cellulomonas triticagri]|uniref:ABC transporter permease subunit n=1 Tax=Cellulomonas triticagri TaxID=2483352 RepID=A0A3M2J5N4_9CELL|nr:ABC transporter permease subunit [Cellulomonas triticagri]RMI09412.1 ABC transporter permease subunit [Cellulomonas triticagri]